MTGWPPVTVCFLVYNRRDELRTSLTRMTVESSYKGDVDVIVVDNASTDGSADMVRREFPRVRVIERDENIGASAWNDAFEVAEGDWVLVLDDDCYLPADGLERAVAGAREHGADLVSFKVVSTYDRDFAFTDSYRTGLLSFWGCAWLIRTDALRTLGGYDPEIFIWANELEFTMRFFDQGYRHLHLPEVVALHMKAPPEPGRSWVKEPAHRINSRHYAYIAGKLLQPRDAAGAIVALLAHNLQLGILNTPVGLLGIPENLKGFVHGLRHRRPLRKRAVSRFYRRNFETFASPWWLWRPVGADYYRKRARYYPVDEAATLKF